jgi:2'-5' RNA ligase
MTEHGPVRAFVALEIPEDVKQALEAAVAPLQRSLPKARWTRPAGWHVTLKFLGEAARPALAEIIHELKPRLAGRGAVTIRLHGSGLFPNQRRPRVAWVGGDAPRVGSIAAAVESVAIGAGFERERRSWSLHLTLARMRGGWPRAAVERFLAWGDDLELSAFECRRAVLFRSELEAGGARYTALESVSLE